jgi:hypothetical protein
MDKYWSESHQKGFSPQEKNGYAEFRMSEYDLCGRLLTILSLVMEEFF